MKRLKSIRFFLPLSAPGKVSAVRAAAGKAMAPFRLRPDYGNRVFGLDIMRAFAIVVVVVGHGRMLNHADTDFPWIKLPGGVELFFVLSGFLIGGLLMRIYERSGRFGGKEILKFWVRRWFRTLPNYYLVLLFNMLVVWLGSDEGMRKLVSWKFFFFLQNFSRRFYGFFTESWSLSIEEWFYLFFPLVLAGVHLCLGRFGAEKKTVFLLGILVFLLVPFLLRFFIASAYVVDQFWLEIKIQRVVIFRLDSIALGIAAAWVQRWHPGFWLKCRNASFLVGMAVIYFLLYAELPPNDFSTKVFIPLLQSAGCALLLPKMDSIKTGPMLLVKTFTHISLISYSMYLLNLPAASLLTKNFPPQGDLAAWTLYVIYWLVTLALSTLLFKYFEKPVMDLRDKIGRG